MALTDTTIRAAKATEKAQKLFDGNGLFLFVALYAQGVGQGNTKIEKI